MALASPQLIIGGMVLNIQTKLRFEVIWQVTQYLLNFHSLLEKTNHILLHCKADALFENKYCMNPVSRTGSGRNGSSRVDRQISNA